MVTKTVPGNPDIVDFDETHRAERRSGTGQEPIWVAYARNDVDSRWQIVGEHEDRDEAEKMALAHKIEE